MADTFSFSHEPRARTRSFDRFIPNRSAMDFDFAHFKLTTPSPKKHGFGGDGNHDDSGCWSPETPEDQRMTDDDVEGLRQDIEGNLSLSKRRLSFSTNVSERTGNDRILQFRSRTKSEDSYGSSRGSREAVLSKLGRTSNNSNEVAARHNFQTERVISIPDHKLSFMYHNLTHSNNRVGFAVDSEVFLWNVTLPASQASKLLESNTYDVLAVSLNTSGNRIAISRECEKDNIEILDVESHSQFTQLGCENLVYDFAWTENGIAFGKSEGYIAFYDLRKDTSTETVLYRNNGDIALSMIFSPNDQCIVTGDAEGSVALWERRMPHKPTWELLVQEGPILRLAWCPWHSHLLACSGIANEDKGAIRILNTLTGVKNKGKDLPDFVTGLGWYKQEQELVTSQGTLFDNKPIVFWEPTTMKKRYALPYTLPINEMMVMGDKRIVCTTLMEMKVYLRTDQSGSSASPRRRANTCASDTLRKSIFKMNMIR
ncbi:uncharacterized protein [Apostichopus japonicus]|uniref:uncharacterized protein n=1 Tax=Stichopus japonicus TaxID=307972 RepID=UPI003AB2F112